MDCETLTPQVTEEQIIAAGKVALGDDHLSRRLQNGGYIIEI